MAVKDMVVRNACPFPVIFFALGGPSFHLESGQTLNKSACAIWFSTRVQGPGAVFNNHLFEKEKDDWTAELGDLGFSSPDWEEGGSGSAAGSFLGIGISELAWVFKIPNTCQETRGTEKELYFGAKKEGVYGNASLVILADLDPAHKLDSQHAAWWHLRIEYDHGQPMPNGGNVPYQVPNLSSYNDSIFIRLYNMKYKNYLSALESGAKLMHSSNQNVQPFNPLTYHEYFCFTPHKTNPYNIKLFNAYTATDGSSQTRYLDSSDGVILNSTQNLDDNSTQVFTIKLLQEQPTMVQISQGGYSFVGRNNGETPFMYPTLNTPDQQWIALTYTINIAKFPINRPFKLMNCKTGKFIRHQQGTDVITIHEESEPSAQWDINYGLYWTIRQADQGYMIFGYGITDTTLLIQKDKQLKALTKADYLPAGCYWDFKTASDSSGFYMINKDYATLSGQNQLFYRPDEFGFYNNYGNFDDQLWVVQF